MLLTDLPEDLLPRGGDCDVLYMTGWNVPVPELSKVDAARPLPHRNPRVFLVVNQEYPANEWAWRKLPPKYVPSGVILGNWWNSAHMDYTDERVASLWVPFGSLSFASRALSSPMNFTRRGTSWRGALRACSQESGAPGEGGAPRLVAYQHRACFTNKAFRGAAWNNYRELFWDRLNRRMLRELETRGTALSTCNGNEGIGAHLRMGSIRKPCRQTGRDDSEYDGSVVNYAHFKAVVALENVISDVGYITEKIVNAFLAESVPIYAGSEHISTLFNPRSFFLLEPGKNDDEVISAVIGALRNDSLYGDMLRHEVISDDAMRRFFSWHPAVWPAHGDSLRRRIVGELLRRCK